MTYTGSKQQFHIALAGNPNVGKSSIFNGLTGLRQHTGNWPGKTVVTASGSCSYNGYSFTIVDLPGTYSLMPHSPEEEVARNYICFKKPDYLIVVCDGTCLERNLNLVFQALEITKNVIVCVNLMDEVKKRQLHVDLEKLSRLLSLPVIGTSIRSPDSIYRLLDTVIESTVSTSAFEVIYEKELEDAWETIADAAAPYDSLNLPKKFLAMRLLLDDEEFFEAYRLHGKQDLRLIKEVSAAKEQALKSLKEKGKTPEHIQDGIVQTLLFRAEEMSAKCVTAKSKEEKKLPFAKLDYLLTKKKTGIPIMILLLFLIFWITITGANYPSALLSDFLFSLEDKLYVFAGTIGIPVFLKDMLIHGMYRVMAWVIAVMLPPMAIFFPLFTLLEDFGYLPRIAFNLDGIFQKACSCGKQALCMCMGLGCNAVGVTGCRIIDSRRERIIAMVTNSFTPCNGRFPTLIALISIFFIGTKGKDKSYLLSALILTAFILFSIGITFLSSWFLSHTVLKGIPSSFTLELPPYRRPQIRKVLVRSVFDRTLFVLGRAVAIAAPAGLVIFLLANYKVSGTTLLTHMTQFLDPLGHMLGMDGVILTAFILGFPANEIVIPLMLTAYLSVGTLTDMGSFAQLHNLFVSQGWTMTTALCVMVFSLCHWPCSTTCLTIQKESGSFKWTLLSIVLPTCVGAFLCFFIHLFSNLLHYI